MSFKDTWTPRIDGEDDADASAVNEIAEAVIENEKSINDIPIEYYSKQDTNNLFANALKGSESGTAVLLSDVSPIEHDLGVRVRSENLLDDTIGTANNLIETSEYGGGLVIDGHSFTAKGGEGSGDLNFNTGQFMFPTAGVSDIKVNGIEVIPNKQYSISFDVLINELGKWENSISCLVYCIKNAEIGVVAQKTSYNFEVGVNSRQSFSFVAPANADINKIGITFRLNNHYITISNIALKEGTETNFTPHISDLSAVKLLAQGKNLIPYPYNETTETVNGITFTDNGDGSITINGTATAGAVFWITSGGDIPEDYIITNEDMFLSGTQDGAGEGNYGIVAVDTTGNYVADYGGGLHLAAGIGVKNLYVYVFEGYTMDNITIYPQLEIGTSATKREPYKSPVEYTVNADGTVDGLKFIAPSTTLMSDTEGVLIECEYNKDANAVVAKLEDRLAALEAAVISQ